MSGDSHVGSGFAETNGREIKLTLLCDKCGRIELSPIHIGHLRVVHKMLGSIIQAMGLPDDGVDIEIKEQAVVSKEQLDEARARFERGERQVVEEDPWKE